MAIDRLNRAVLNRRARANARVGGWPDVIPLDSPLVDPAVAGKQVYELIGKGGDAGEAGRPDGTPGANGAPGYVELRFPMPASELIRQDRLDTAWVLLNILITNDPPHVLRARLRGLYEALAASVAPLTAAAGKDPTKA